jgi:hypothetical protein
MAHVGRRGQRVPPALSQEIRNSLAHDHEAYAGYRVLQMDYFWDKLLRYGGSQYNYQIRLFRPQTFRVTRDEVHARIEVDGRTRVLRAGLTHIRTESVWDHVEHLNRYSNLETIKIYRTGRGIYFHRAPSTVKQRVLQRLFKLPGKPLAKFGYDYSLRRGFLDGRAGFLRATLDALYVYWSYVKLRELRTGQVPAEAMKARAQPVKPKNG